ncbi:MAG: transcriptional regulator, TetR family [Lachnospiraceae bacterium]|jgi:AcrR family transcriptional regulator|nr:transcriptional regulator, TetR family [Lachnospiraceae bacterium]
MNEQFLDLPKEKQSAIINAALEVFSKNEYKRAVTEDIAAKAGISKGLLFYYFHNKKSLYFYLMEYSIQLMMEQLIDEKYKSIKDFFELLEYVTHKKVAILVKNPYIYDFIMRAYFEVNNLADGDAGAALQNKLSGSYAEYLSGIDFSKFRQDVNPQDIFNMIFWLADGYIHDKRNKGIPIVIDEMVAEYRKWTVLIKRSAYKEEFLE